jgi:predicted nucleic acid-binding protein
VKFWDTSAVVPLCVSEPTSTTVKALLADDSIPLVWWGTRTECISAFMRQVREGNLNIPGERQARQVLGSLAQSWIEILPSESVRSSAERLLAVHTLRAADALQLAAALQWRQRDVADYGFICFDSRLREAAYKEGFLLFPPELPS